MDKLIPVHFSLADWSFQPGVGFAIGSEHFVSPPSALRRPTGPGQGTIGYLSLKEAISGNLNDGRIITWRRYQSITHYIFDMFVRAQTAPYLGLPANCYQLSFWHFGCSVTRWDDGVPTGLATYNEGGLDPINSWRRYRVTWYTWLDAALEPILRFLIDYWDAGVWVNRLLFDEANPHWQASPTNLIGFALRGEDANNQMWIDDTLVYKRSV